MKVWRPAFVDTGLWASTWYHVDKHRVMQECWRLERESGRKVEPRQWTLPKYERGRKR